MSLDFQQKKHDWLNIVIIIIIIADDKVKMKESEKIDKYLGLARKLKKKLWTIKVTVIPVVIGAHCTVLKSWQRD